MKKFGMILSLLTLITVTGCESETSYGECLGIQSEASQNPNLVYKPSVRNIVLGVIFFETLFAPAIWLLSDFNCPVAYKTNPPTSVK